MNVAQLHQWASVLVLAALLFLPASRVIWVLSVRRLQRRRGAELSAPELAGQRNRARVLALPLVLLFAWLFYGHVISPLYGYRG